MDFLDKSGYVLSDIDNATHVAFAGDFYTIAPPGRYASSPKIAELSGSFVHLYDTGHTHALSVRKDRLAAANLHLVRKRDPVKLAVSHTKHGYTCPFSGVELTIPGDFYPEHDAFRVTIEGL